MEELKNITNTQTEIHQTLNQINDVVSNASSLANKHDISSTKHESSSINSETDLSTTLLERRKRLHVLANEINQWEDESIKNNHIQLPANTSLTATPPTAPPNFTFDYLNKTQNSFSSPKQQTYQFKMKSPSPFKQQTNTSINKENKSPYPPPVTSVSLSSKQQQFVTPSNSEIITVAQRLIAKRQSNSQPNNNIVLNIIKNTSIEDENIHHAHSESLVKSLKSKFESNSENNTNTNVQMTPKLIIKKFEQMLKDGSQAQPLTGAMANNAISNPTTQSSSNIRQDKLTKNSSNNQINESIINTDHIKPKSIIEKFEMLVKSNAPSTGVVAQLPPSINVVSLNHAENQIIQSDIHKKNSNASACGYSYYTTGSLTYVSSMVSSTMTTSPNTSKSNHVDNEYYVEEDNDDAIYEELQETQAINDNKIKENKNERTSLFEEDAQSITSSSIKKCNQETCSISGTSYTGSLINQDEFEEDEYLEHQESEFMSNDEYESYDQGENDMTTDNDYTTSNTHDEDTTIYTSDNKNFVTIKSPSVDYVANTESKLDCLSNGTYIVNTSNNNTNNNNNNNNCNDVDQLFSIKEYRKQKRRLLNGGRRSSVMPMNKTSTSNLVISNLTTTSNLSTLSNICTKNGKPPLTSKVTEISDDKQKRIKNLERIKELEELIKQEDNVIHQTGIALERCLNDTNFTGSSEHIECNRILLISCQKRQAFLTEINRLKQLISNFNINKKSPISNASTSNDEKSSKLNEMSNNSFDMHISPTDLTGLLIFSDIQLPIKESYINKLKSNEEKRIFYFLCLIRNGIQVLQTQVISVQELIATKETSITFPNRMAISNVDINFKVKIDVYTFEVLPKDTRSTKQNIASNATSKFFSPFKNNLLHSLQHLHHGSNSNHGSNSLSGNSNHHYNEHNSLAGSGAGGKTSNFIHVDTIEITMKDISNNKFKLSISSSSIPLTGLLFLNVRCMPSKSIELKGFMTLFEDINGMGSWDRRWCFLNNYNISYWKYPEDEYRNGPLGVINLTKCLNDRVNILTRDICARKFTIELSICNSLEGVASYGLMDDGKNKIKRYRLSADTKDQASDWLTNINYALANLRLWNLKPLTSK